MALQVFHDPAVTDIAEPRLRELWLYWRGLCDTGRLPSRDDVDPQRIMSVLPWTMLIDVTDRDHYFYRLVGTQIVRNVGYDMTGQQISRAYAGPDWGEVRKDYDYVVRTQRPCLTLNRLQLTPDVPAQSYQRLLCPLSSDGAQVDILIGAAIQESEYQT